MKHLTPEQHGQILALKNENFSLREIQHKIGIPKSTI
ncbi:hypothetical protein H312_02916, partial [Anncaliia algerae PRA339]